MITDSKFRIFKSDMLFVLLYGCESWDVTKDCSTNKLKMFTSQVLSRILGILWPEKKQQCADMKQSGSLAHVSEKRVLDRILRDQDTGLDSVKSFK